MSQITTHILDTTRGLPASNVPVTLFAETESGWQQLAKDQTDENGRISHLLADNFSLDAGIYRMHFDTKKYFSANNETGFYPFVDIVFEIDASGSHYHIPLLLTAFGYSTYRGS